MNISIIVDFGITYTLVGLGNPVFLRPLRVRVIMGFTIRVKKKPSKQFALFLRRVD